MPIINNLAYFKKSDRIDFDTLHNPGDPAPYSGIYRCEICGLEATSEEDKPLPPGRSHNHSSKAVIWRLVAQAKHKP